MVGTGTQSTIISRKLLHAIGEKKHCEEMTTLEQPWCEHCL